MEDLQEAGQIGLGEIVGPHAGIEAVQAEVDGVGAVFDGRFGAVPITGRGEQFGKARRRAGRLRERGRRLDYGAESHDAGSLMDGRGARQRKGRQTGCKVRGMLLERPRRNVACEFR